MSQKRDLEPKTAEEIAQDFLAKTRDLYKRVEIAGSIRRGSPVVHDIDFAVIPGLENFNAWREQVKRRVTEMGGTVKSFGDTIADFIYRDVQVNLFLCPSEESWGVTLMWATGPKGHTIGMNIKARSKGLLANSKGIWTRDAPPKLIPAPTEEDVGRILDWKYKPPETRGKETKDDKIYF